MPAGTISLSNGSPTVTGDATTFTTEVNTGEFLLISDGGTNYTLPVISVDSDTQLTLSDSFTGPTASGLSYRAISSAQLVSVPTQLINQTTLAIRGLNNDKANWNQLLTVDGDVTITAPDSTTISGPSWPKVAKGIDTADLEKVTAIADEIQTNRDAAAASEANAATSEQNAALSETNAASSASDSATSAQQSADSAASIEGDVQQAAASAAAASDSADRAEDAAKQLENNNEFAVTVDHIDGTDIYFKTSVYSGADSAEPASLTALFVDAETPDDGTLVQGGDLRSTYQADGADYGSTVIHTTASIGGNVSAEIVVTDSSGDDPVTKTFGLPDNEGKLLNLDGAGLVSADDTNILSKGSISVGTEAAKDNDLVTLRQLRSATAGIGEGGPTLNGVMNNQLGSVSWFNGSRAAMWAGHLAADGQVLSRSEYAELWSAVNSGLFLSVDETTWQTAESTGYSNRAKYSQGGDAGTSPDANVSDAWFRLPDLNGSQSGSLANPYLRGSGPDNTNPGRVHPDGAPNITGGFVVKVPDGHAGKVLGAFTGSNGSGISPNTDTAIYTGIQGTGDNQDPSNYGYHFDASQSYSGFGRSAAEIRPTSAIGIWVLRVTGIFNAANTNFNVINADSTLPATGSVVTGGDLRSLYQVNGADYAAVGIRPRVTVGTGINAEIRLIDSSGSTINTKTWTLPETEGELISQNSSGITNLNTVDATILRASNEVEWNNGTQILNYSFQGQTLFTNYSNVSNIDFNGLWLHTSTVSVNSNTNIDVRNQGMHFLWNETGGQGEGDIVINRGSGVGGLHIRVVNLDNSQQLTAYTFSGDGILDCPNGSQSFGGRIRAFTDVGANQIMAIVDGNTKVISLTDSDERLKEEIVDADEEHALSIIEKIRPVCFRFKDYIAKENVQDETGQYYQREINVIGKFHRFGVIAQEVEKILPEAVITNKDEAGYKSIDTMEMLGLLITTAHAQLKLIKELKSQAEDANQNFKKLVSALGYLADGDEDSFKDHLNELRGVHI